MISNKKNVRIHLIKIKQKKFRQLCESQLTSRHVHFFANTKYVYIKNLRTHTFNDDDKYTHAQIPEQKKSNFQCLDLFQPLHLRVCMLMLLFRRYLYHRG